MEISFKIERKDNCECNPDCVFLDGEYFQHCGNCLLFQQTLTPVMEYSSIIGWRCCKSCNTIARKVLALEVASTLDEPF